MFQNGIYSALMLCTAAFTVVVQASAPVTFDLSSAHATWSLVNANGTIRVAATVPGCVHTDLMSAQIITDPNYGYNELLQRWIATDNFTYTASFALPSSPGKGSVDLEAQMLDTAARITLNGQDVLTANNMHRRWRAPVSSVLNWGGVNTLVVAFTGPVPFSASQQSSCNAANSPYCPPPWQGPAPDPIVNNAYVRKEQDSFSWDFAPATGTSGIVGPVSLVAYDSVVMDGVVIDTSPVASSSSSPIHASVWTLTARVRLFTSVPGSQSVNVTLSLPSGPSGPVSSTVTVPVAGGAGYTVAQVELNVTQPQLWWPNGYGPQALYTATVSTVGVTGESSSRNVTVGFRTFSLDQTPVPSPDPGNDGHLFRFVVNGVPILARGSNWVPPDSLQARVTTASVNWLFDSYHAAGWNTLRVWGGGVYASDDVLAAADAAGILIYHDAMFGDQFYPSWPSFLENVAAEMGDAAWRMGSHPSLALWCGNNEMASGYQEHGYEDQAQYYSDLYFRTVLANISAADPWRPWVSSTPSNGNETAERPFHAEGESIVVRGDMHYYDLDSDCWNISMYPRARFITEHGWESWPSFQTLGPTLTGTADWAYNSSLLVSREHHPPGQEQMSMQVETNYVWPSSGNGSNETVFRQQLWMTQVAQGQCFKIAAEQWRSMISEYNESMYGATHGILLWQANDIWPGPSWSLVEYGGRPKLAFYLSQAFYADVLISGYVQPASPGAGGQDAVVVYVSNGQAAGAAAGAQTLPANTQVCWTLWPWSGRGLPTTTCQLTGQAVPPMSSIRVMDQPLSGLLASAPSCGGNASACFVTFALSSPPGTGFAPITSNWMWISRFNEVTTMVDPQLTVLSVTAAGTASSPMATYDVFNVTLSVTAPAAFVWLESPLPGRWTDNGFLLPCTVVPAPPGGLCTRLVQFISASAHGSVSPAALSSSLLTWSLYDTAPDAYGASGASLGGHGVQ